MTDLTLEQVIENRARAIAWTELTEIGKRECKWPDDFGEDEVLWWREKARATIKADRAMGLDDVYRALKGQDDGH